MTNIDVAPAIELLLHFFGKHEIQIPLPDEKRGLAILDPHAQRIVGSHYALSHYCAGLLMLSWKRGDEALMLQAERYLDYIEASHLSFSKERDYHADFNNFAWALLLLIDRDHHGFLKKPIKDRLVSLLLSTADSNNVTVNWLPMRAFNHLVRHQYGGGDHHISTAKKLLQTVSKAQSPDGMYDDLLPVGISGNVQYHVYTTAVLQLIRHFRLDDGGGDVVKALEFTKGVIDPEGDFNYVGRGANQLFGWGPFFFNLLGIANTDSTQERCHKFFYNNLQQCLQNNGLLLANSHPAQNHIWWDYHYCTVYAAHLFLWCNLVNFLSPEKHSVDTVPPRSNLEVFSTADAFLAVFHGKSHYLCERGPTVCNIWTKGIRTFFKSPLGPFYDDFGQKHISKAMVVMNYLGPLTEYSENFFGRIVPLKAQRLLRRLHLNSNADVNYGVVLRPVFPNRLTVNFSDDCIEIQYQLAPLKTPICFNVPLLQDSAKQNADQLISVEMDGNAVSLVPIGSVVGTGGCLQVFRSPLLFKVHNITLRIYI